MSKEAMTFTANDAASRLGVDRAIAYGFLRFLVEKNVAEECGTHRIPGAKGKGATVYQLVDDPAGKMAEIVGLLLAK